MKTVLQHPSDIVIELWTQSCGHKWLGVSNEESGEACSAEAAFQPTFKGILWLLVKQDMSIYLYGFYPEPVIPKHPSCFPSHGCSQVISCPHASFLSAYIVTHFPSSWWIHIPWSASKAVLPLRPPTGLLLIPTMPPRQGICYNQSGTPVLSSLIKVTSAAMTLASVVPTVYKKSSVSLVLAVKESPN